ncbi:hypothetical protein Cni_G03903 [Canna indica]|uniref:H15 domain-containing protein n=1 Tax=Canna indica TaxID=4628 RepID=A0AAQ3JSH7_9LILI|nr:hypothetical protein Cni_G03903 [Canna indica]
MSTDVAAEVNPPAPVADEQATEAPAGAKPAEKPTRERKARAAKAPKEKKPKDSKASTLSHPPYFQMIKEAILSLNEKTGSSPYAIAKFMEEKHKGVLPPNFKKVLAVQLRNFTAKGKLVKVKASFKLSEAGKKEETKRKKDVKKPEKEMKKPEKEAPKRKVPTDALKEAAKPAKAKKTASKKTKKASPAPKPKQPKSIKSPAAKKARKAEA